MRKPVAALITAGALFGAAEAACREDQAAAARYVVCDFDPATDEIRLFLNDEAGAPYGDFAPIATALEAGDEALVFAMNAGMYHKDRTPVGLYVEQGAEKKRLSTKDGPGNFHLKPNGVFWIDAAGAHVADTEEFSAPSPPASFPQADERREIIYATQSGPMLVIDGAIHPRFLVDATSRKRRNGVGVRADGVVVFALSDMPVTFHEFAAYFRDTLKTPNALYLDGTISRLYAPELQRNDPGLAMGPIVGVVKRRE